MKLLIIVFIVIIGIKLYIADKIMNAGVSLSLVEPRDYEEKDYKKSFMLFKSYCWKFQLLHMMQVLYTTMALLMLETGAFVYKKYVLNSGAYTYREIVEANLVILITIMIVLVCNNLSFNNYRQETLRLKNLGDLAIKGPLVYMPGCHPGEDDVIEIKDYTVENKIHIIIRYLINCTPCWKILCANSIQLTQRYVKYIFQCHPKLASRLVKSRVLFSNGMQLMSNGMILIVGLKVILT